MDPEMAYLCTKPSHGATDNGSSIPSVRVALDGTTSPQADIPAGEQGRASTGTATLGLGLSLVSSADLAAELGRPTGGSGTAHTGTAYSGTALTGTGAGAGAWRPSQATRAGATTATMGTHGRRSSAAGPDCEPASQAPGLTHVTGGETGEGAVAYWRHACGRG